MEEFSAVLFPHSLEVPFTKRIFSPLVFIGIFYFNVMMTPIRLDRLSSELYNSLLACVLLSVLYINSLH